MHSSIKARQFSLSEMGDDYLREAERLFEWALSYERKGLQAAADALRDEGQKSLKRYMEICKENFIGASI